jgi:hypothetical protein
VVEGEEGEERGKEGKGEEGEEEKRPLVYMVDLYTTTHTLQHT